MTLSFSRSRRRSFWPSVVLSTLFFLLPQNAILSAADEVWPRFETRHFLILAEPMPQPSAMSLADWDAALTQYVGQLDEKLAPLFGDRTLSPPRRPLSEKPILLICADKRSYLVKLAEYGVLPPDGSAMGSGGFYHPESNVIFTWRQPTDYYSRHVVLHEIAHWYCLQLLGERYVKMPLWLCEGLADFAAMHTWDGQTLHAMRMPRVSLENYPARLDASLRRLKPEGELSPETITQRFEQLRSDPGAENSALVYDEYALAWGLVAFLIDAHADEMRQLFEQLTKRDMPESWQAAFAQIPTWPRFTEWVGENRLPWQWVWNHWEDEGRHLVGVSDSTALIVQNPALNTERLSCHVTTLLENTVVGLVFRYENADDFDMVQFRDLGKTDPAWRHVRLAQKKWQPLTPWQKITPTAENRAADREATLELRRSTSSGKKKWQFFFDSRLLVEIIDNDDKTEKICLIGLAVQTGAARFCLP